MRILQIQEPRELKQLMQDIRVDPYGIKIMLPKAVAHLIKMNSVSNITANILKQEMLSIGGDVAVARGALTGRAKKTDCLLMGTLSQFGLLNKKLYRQPFGLNSIAYELSRVLSNYQKEKFILDLGRFRLNLGSRTHIMGILNLTPDSFSGDGLYSSLAASRFSLVDKAMVFVEKMVKDGADIIDVGGESSRPGARPVSVVEELSRTIPVIKALSKKIKVPLSIDTYKPRVAKEALDNGVSIVNDISGLRNPMMAKLISKYKAAVVTMHMKGTPFNMQRDAKYSSLIDEIINYLGSAINRAEAAGVPKDKIIIDPGIGFGKLAEHNLEILRKLKEFKVLGKPIMVGTSRKSFIGKILNRPADERVFGTVSSCCLAAANGANIIRAHDVKEVSQALRVLDRIKKI